MYWLSISLLVIGLIFMVKTIIYIIPSGNLENLNSEENVNKIISLMESFISIFAFPFILTLFAESKLSHIKSIKYHTENMRS